MGKRNFRKKTDRHNIDWQEMPLLDKEIFEYYTTQLKTYLQTEKEIEDFCLYLKEPLPSCFRINSTIHNNDLVIKKILQEGKKAEKDKEEFYKKFIEETKKKEAEKKQPLVKKEDKTEKQKNTKMVIKKINWYPFKTVYQINLDRQTLKKTPHLKSFHRYLQKSSECGLITRQELVSMIPPVFLDIKSDDLVLDMCAAPGSKTSQIVEFISNKDSSLQIGGVFANEIDFKRAWILSHQMKKLNTAGASVINHNGQFIPNIYSKEKNIVNKEGINFDNKIYFDKVLADVPCSGDGALRKLPGRWKKWSPKDGIHLHPLQVNILKRAVDLTKVGGLVCYSTCSLNAIENEAVVGHIMRLANNVNPGSLELVDVHGKLEGFKLRKGISDWKVPFYNKNENGEVNKEKIYNYMSTYDEFLKVNKGDEKICNVVKSSMFCKNSKEMVEDIKIQHTARVMPHDNNTGGFYFALFRKKNYILWENPDEEIEKAIKKERKIREMEKKRKNGKGRFMSMQNLETYKPVSKEFIETLKEQYGFDDTFPFHLLIVLSNSNKRVKITTEKILNYLESDVKKLINKVYIGTNAFHKGKGKDKVKDYWRICQDGIHVLEPFLKKNRTKIDLKTFEYILQNPTVSFDKIPENLKYFKDQVSALEYGSYCFQYFDKEYMSKPEFMAVNKMNHSYVLMVTKEDIAGLKVKYLD